MAKRRESRAERGLALGTVLLIIFVTAILAFTLATASSYQLKVSQGIDSQAHARNLAESVVNKAMARISENPEFGKNRETTEAEIDDLGSAILTFDRSRAAAEGVEVSLHNLDNKDALTVGGVTVPREAVRLVGRATVGRSTSELECVYFRPAFPVALSAGGDLEASGLYLGGLIDGVPFPGIESMGPANSRPADLISNGSLTSLNATCNILGDITAAGDVQVAEGANVRGSIRTKVTPTTAIPKVSIPDLVRQLNDTGIDPAPPRPDSGGPSNVLFVEFYDVHTGRLEHNGDIELSGGVLHIKGDLDVRGEVRGRGTILVEGSAVLRGRASLGDDDATNVICNGNLELRRGDGFANKSRFRGLFYCDGVFRSENTLILGSVVSHGAATVHNAQIVHTTPSTSMAFGVPKRYRDLSYTVFWKVDPVRNPQTGNVRYNYTVSVYRGGGVDSNDRSSSRHLATKRGNNKSRGQLMAELPAFVKLMTPPLNPLLPVPSFLGDRIAIDLAFNADEIARPTPPANLVISLNLNDLLAPVQRDRILLWRFRRDL